MAQVRILLEREPKNYRECPFSDFCGWACHVHEDGECVCLSGNDDGSDNFDFSKCPCCKAID